MFHLQWTIIGTSLWLQLNKYDWANSIHLSKLYGCWIKLQHFLFYLLLPETYATALFSENTLLCLISFYNFYILFQTYIWHFSFSFQRSLFILNDQESLVIIFDTLCWKSDQCIPSNENAWPRWKFLHSCICEQLYIQGASGIDGRFVTQI